MLGPIGMALMQSPQIWHTVIDGEVCLGLIDKSSSGFDLEKFHKLNPSVNDDCSNLENGQAYCVDTEGMSYRNLVFTVLT